MSTPYNDAIKAASIARNYNFNELLYLITLERTPRQLAASLYHTILTLQAAELPIKDHDGNEKNASHDLSNLCKLMEGFVRLECELEEDFILVFHPRAKR